MKTSEFDYQLPPELIAQTPVEPRHASRLLVLDRTTGNLTHSHFHRIGQFLHPNDLLVVNHTRVLPARLYANKIPSGGKVELLLLSQRDQHTWEVIVGGKRVTQGVRLQLENGITAEVTEELDGPRRLLRFNRPIEPHLDQIGHTPLPPYIHTPLENPNRYQTVYAQETGSAAAPTAGLHFTQQLLDDLLTQGINKTTLTLHVGLDTFLPVTEDDPANHHIHTEWCQLTPESADQINATHKSGGRILAVGTTSVRTLETASSDAKEDNLVTAFEGSTALFILPGYQFHSVDALITNFHLPRSTLLMLVSAFAGYDLIMDAYHTAIKERYRFYSFGDAMLIL